MQAAYLRLVCNGWCTLLVRMWGQHPDSVEHFAQCPVVRRLCADCVGLVPPDPGRALDMFLGFDWAEDEVRLRGAVTYALYAVHNARRHGTIGPEQLEGAFREALREATRGT